jgi:hypothetical protein
MTDIRVRTYSIESTARSMVKSTVVGLPSVAAAIEGERHSHRRSQQGAAMPVRQSRYFLTHAAFGGVAGLFGAGTAGVRGATKALAAVLPPETLTIPWIEDGGETLGERPAGITAIRGQVPVAPGDRMAGPRHGEAIAVVPQQIVKL